MNYHQEELRLILGMAGVALVTMIVLLTPLIADMLDVALR